MMVSRIQLDDIVEIFEIRGVLDVLALELFMKTGNTEIVEQMKQSVTDMKTCLEKKLYREFIHADSMFHHLYIHNSGNHRLEKIWEDINEQEQRFLAVTLKDDNRCKISYRHHVKIIEKIEQGDIKGATNALKRHLADSMEYHIKKVYRL